jgi:hypothetical protein
VVVFHFGVCDMLGFRADVLGFSESELFGDAEDQSS